MKMRVSCKTWLPLHEIWWDETSNTDSVEGDAIIMILNLGAQLFVWKLENKHISLLRMYVFGGR